MFTPQEIQEQTFSKAVFGGYDMQQVDDFLEPLTEDYITLYKENSVLKAKMKILVEKLEEYRAQETQQASATAEAEAKSAQLLKQTQAKCAAMLQNAEVNAQANAQVNAANVQLAQLNLSYCYIIATCDGVVGTKDIQEGMLVQPGQTLVNIVDAGSLWVEANYKESQLDHIHEGSEAQFTVDAVPGIVYRGRVERISRATGSAFSLLPVDNATGNFVKVEQRVTVRIALDGNSAKHLARLHAGYNVECEVKY